MMHCLRLAVQRGDFVSTFGRHGLLLSTSPNTGMRQQIDVDHLGTVRLLTNRSSGQLNYHVYLPYGEESAVT